MSSSAVGLILIIVIGIIAVGILIGAILLIRWAWKSQTSGAMQAGAYVGAGCLLLGLFGCPAVMLPVFFQAKEAAKRTQCMANLNSLARAFQLYAGDNSDRLPPRAWTDPLLDYTGDPMTYVCPSLDQPYGYTINSVLFDRTLSDVKTPESVPLAFDGPGGKDSVGEVSVMQLRHIDEACAVHLTGAARRYSKSD